MKLFQSSSHCSFRGRNVLAIQMQYSLLLLMVFPNFAITQPASTFDRIQQQILNSNCSGCHSAGTSFATQSGLVLTSDVAYRNLIDVIPRNSAAAADSLVRVSSEGTLRGLSRSFLWEKINAPEQFHFYADHPYYGSIMPLGMPYLTNGELAYIRAWIIAGGPEAGEVADTAILNDTTRYALPEFIALEPPTRGIQFRVGPFEVRPNQVYDREFFFYVPSTRTEDLFIRRVEISMRPGSHHFLLYTFAPNTPSNILPQPEVYRDIRDSSGNLNYSVLFQMQYHRFLTGTQTPYLNYHFPRGVALRLPRQAGIDLNSHYVNRSTQPILGEVYANLSTVDSTEVDYVAETLFLSNTDLYLPAYQVTTVEKTFTFNQTRSIVFMWSHAHEHMVEFRVYRSGGGRDGELVYFSDDWKHPPILNLDPPLTINSGEGLRLSTTYNNTTDRVIRFGLLSSDEMQILFGASYAGVPSSASGGGTRPTAYALHQNHPNPFNPSTTIRYDLPVRSRVTLRVFDLLGRAIATLIDQSEEAGIRQARWDARDVASGIYVYRLEAQSHESGSVRSFTQSGKMVVIR